MGAFSGRTESLTKKQIQAIGLTLMLLASARPVHAQDITVLVVAIAPPILLAPFCLALARSAWLRRRSRSPPGIVALLLNSCVEIVLWGAVIFSVLLIMTGDFSVGALIVPVVAGVGLWMLSGIWIEGSDRAARWIYFASPPLVLGLLVSAAWLVLITFWQ